ncbi:MAG: stage V sporulation protein AE [Ruminococcus sp.]|nr:stage V sporulation protein AE [Ruminococcus sp.]
MEFVHAFWVGGLICALAQILLDKTKLMPGRIMVLLVCLGSIISAIGLYEPLADFAKAGATVPLIGFGHLLFQGVKDEIDQIGFLGTFVGGLKASAAGISAALIFGYLASIIFQPKMKK